MIRDPIVDEVRAVREELAARFDFDIRKIVEDAQKRQAASQSRVVSFQKPNQSLRPTGPVVTISDRSQLPRAGPAGER